MDITIDPASATAPYEQIRQQVARQAADGTLAAGFRIPPVRTLAAHLGVATGTVARAYKELEAAGLVETRGRHGTVITARAAATDDRARQAAAAYAGTCRALGVPPEVALALVRAALQP